MTTKKTTKKVSVKLTASVVSRTVPSSDQLQSEMEALGHILSKNKNAAHKFLLGAGIVTEKGNLKKVYGG